MDEIDDVNLITLDTPFDIKHMCVVARAANVEDIFRLPIATSRDYFFVLEPDSMMTWHDHITVDPAVCHGKACITGTRIPVAVVLANLADGISNDGLLGAYPGLSATAIQASLEYAAELVAERVIVLPMQV